MRVRRMRVRRLRVAGVLAVVAAVAALGQQSLTSSSSTAAPPIHSVPSAQPRATSEPRRERQGALGEAGGAVPDGATVFDDGIPAVGNLDPVLLAALRRAAGDAAAYGVAVGRVYDGTPIPMTTAIAAAGLAAAVVFRLVRGRPPV